ncbi:MAG: DNA-methyltransferase [Nitrososphaerales archaeon]
MTRCEISLGDCERFLEATSVRLDLSFLDPPFNQGKEYNSHDDDMPTQEYWNWMKRICKLIFDHSNDGAAIYFMQREKNSRFVLEALEDAGWTYQNLIIWQKKTSAVPCERKFGLHYQIIAFATKGKNPRVFNKLRIDPPLLVTEKFTRPNGVFVTDVWDDIRELTSGYFAGDEPLRSLDGERAHKQQSPVQLLLRIILSSSNVDDVVFDPFAGTGTTLVVARQLQRHSIGVELDPQNVLLIQNRMASLRPVDNITRFRKDYLYTVDLDTLWPANETSPPTLINDNDIRISD